MRVLIIDDEHLARDIIRGLVANHPDLEIAGEAATGPDAVAAIERLAPDLVLLDVALPTMDGFEVLAAVQTSPLPLVIFTTAYDQHAIRAFTIHAVDYLLKPIEAARFAEAIARATARHRRDADEEMRRFVEQQTSHATRLTVRQGDRILFLKPEEIDWIEAVGNYVRIHRGDDQFPLRQTLSALEEQLQPRGFVRIQRSLLVNVERVVELRRHAREQFSVILTSGTKLPLSPNYRASLENALTRRG